MVLIEKGQQPHATFTITAIEKCFVTALAYIYSSKTHHSMSIQRICKIVMFKIDLISWGLGYFIWPQKK